MNRNMRAIIFFCIFLIPLLMSCSKREAGPIGDRSIRVITTLFPLYDFARNTGGKKAQVELLLPPGMEPHSFEPRPADIRKINDADIFVYTGKFMEPWVEEILKGISNKNLLVIDASTGVALAEDLNRAEHLHGDKNSDDRHAHHHGHGIKDPHIWLDFSNAQTMVENILNGFIAKDPANRQEYMKNATAYVSQLSALDERFRNALSSCGKRVMIHGGHFAFGYLAKRYHLQYLSAYRGFSSNAEPAPGDIIALIQNIRKHRLNYIFIEELVSPNLAETISRETGVKILMLHGAHNISKDEWDQNATFLSLMEMNLKNLTLGLECL